MRLRPLLLLVLCICTGTFAPISVATPATTPTKPAAATTSRPASAASITTLQAITVTGVVPGPGLWQVNLGDHIMWILGVVQTLPAGIQWRSAQVAHTIAGSQTVLEAPDVNLTVDANWFSKLFLLLPLYHAQRNPGGKTLADVLPPSLYTRWQVQKQRYFGDDHGIERYRPILAASKLMKKALKAHGLRSSGKVEDSIAALAKHHGVKTVATGITLVIRHPHKAIKVFENEGPQGIACFRQTLGVVEHRIPAIRARANAWATGNITALRRLPGHAYRNTCISAIVDAGFAKSLGLNNLRQRVKNHWLGAAESALASDAQSVAVLPMHDLLGQRGYLAALRARGYSVVAPDAQAAGTPATASSAAAANAASVH